jgi:hypothetical protein
VLCVAFLFPTAIETFQKTGRNNPIKRNESFRVPIFAFTRDEVESLLLYIQLSRITIHDSFVVEQDRYLALVGKCLRKTDPSSRSKETSLQERANSTGCPLQKLKPS